MLLRDDEDHVMADIDEHISVRITCSTRLRDKSVKLPSLSCLDNKHDIMRLGGFSPILTFSKRALLTHRK